MEHLNISDLVVDDKWNARFGNFKEDVDYDNATSYETLRDSMRDCGLLMPIHVSCLSDGRFFVTAGFRRVHAAKELGWTTIPAIVHQMNSASARLLNLRENLNRASLSRAEIAQGLLNAKRECPLLSNQELARTIGIYAPAATDLLTIAQGLTKEVFEQWRQCEHIIGIQAIKRIAQMPRDMQADALRHALAKKRLRKRNGIRRNTSTLKTEARRLGERLAILMKQGLLEDLKGEWEDIIRYCLPIPPECSRSLVSLLAGLAAEHYEAILPP